MLKLYDIASQNINTRACFQELYLCCLRGCPSSLYENPCRLNMRRVFRVRTLVPLPFEIKIFFFPRPLKEHLSKKLYCFKLHLKIETNTYNISPTVKLLKRLDKLDIYSIYSTISMEKNISTSV